MRTRTLSNKYYAHYRKFFRNFPNFNIVRRRHAIDRMEEYGVQLPQILRKV